MRKPDRDKMYVIDGQFAEAIWNLRERLYHDHVPWKPGEHRDWANKLDAYFSQLGYISEYTPEQK